MSGHSKWATTKRAKAVVDAKRANIFTKIAHMITIAAREKGSDPNANFSLRLAIEKARDANMPKENIERAIQRGVGGLAGQQLEEITYEGFGPGGVALIIHVLTDNRNRAVSEIKHLLSKYGGSLGAQNSVQWMFEKKGVLGLEGQLSEEQELVCIEAGADDIVLYEGKTTILTTPENFERVKEAAESLKLPLAFAKFDLRPKTPVACTNEGDQERLHRLIEALEELDDVTECFTNCE